MSRLTPLTYPAAGEPKNASTVATSRGETGRPFISRMFQSTIWSLVVCRKSGSSGVSIGPGHTLFVRTPCRIDGRDDRIVNTFHDGFVIQYQLRGVMTNGHTGSLWICIVARVRDGRITRIDEYMDSGRFAAWAGTEEAKA